MFAFQVAPSQNLEDVINLGGFVGKRRTLLLTQLRQLFVLAKQDILSCTPKKDQEHALVIFF